MTRPRKRRRRGSKPTYTPETAQARGAGQLAVRIAPEAAARIRERALDHPGGVSGLVASLAEDRPAPAEAGLHDLLQEGPILLTTDSTGDVIVRLIRGPVPPLSVAAEGAGPGLEEALAGLRQCTR